MEDWMRMVELERLDGWVGWMKPRTLMKVVRPAPRTAFVALSLQHAFSK